VPRG